MTPDSMRNESVLTQNVIHDVTRLHVNVELLHLRETSGMLSHVPIDAAVRHIMYPACFDQEHPELMMERTLGNGQGVPCGSNHCQDMTEHKVAASQEAHLFGDLLRGCDDNGVLVGDAVMGRELPALAEVARLQPLLTRLPLQTLQLPTQSLHMASKTGIQDRAASPQGAAGRHIIRGPHRLPEQNMR